MARRRIGQERLAVGGEQQRAASFLDQLTALVDWAEIDRLLAVSPHVRGVGRVARPTLRG